MITVFAHSKLVVTDTVPLKDYIDGSLNLGINASKLVFRIRIRMKFVFLGIPIQDAYPDVFSKIKACSLPLYCNLKRF
jgi:hypothetical protein